VINEIINFKNSEVTQDRKKERELAMERFRSQMR
jgi:hypothetical protein